MSWRYSQVGLQTVRSFNHSDVKLNHAPGTIYQTTLRAPISYIVSLDIRVIWLLPHEWYFIIPEPTLRKWKMPSTERYIPSCEADNSCWSQPEMSLPSHFHRPGSNFIPWNFLIAFISELHCKEKIKYLFLIGSHGYQLKHLIFHSSILIYPRYNFLLLIFSNSFQLHFGLSLFDMHIFFLRSHLRETSTRGIRPLSFYFHQKSQATYPIKNISADLRCSSLDLHQLYYLIMKLVRLDASHLRHVSELRFWNNTGTELFFKTILSNIPEVVGTC